ncbi:MAG: DNA-directed RNA polymerase subunit beta, partial [Candidatus Tagabacteria bacterium CG_4_9_14_0_2_um_filter_41_11]
MHKKYFAKYKEPFIPLPNLVEMQLNSFNWFLKEGLKELFHEFSPINDYAGKEFFLEFLDYSIDEPKYDEYYAKANNLSYEVPLKIRVRLTKKETQETKEQDVFLTDMPLMTEHGTFIVNGVERVVVAQLARSFGVYFTINVLRGRNLFGAKIIPNRGAWIEVETDFDGVMYVRIDRKRKIPVTTFLRVFGLKDSKEIEKNFSKVDNGEINYIKKTFEKDDASTVEEAYVEIYKRIRPGELATVENAKELLDDMFSPSRYDFSSVGRYKFNQRLGLPLKDIKSASRTLSLEDLIAVVSEVINMNNNPEAQPDDIDHLGNRRIRAVGEMLQNQLRIGMARMKRNIQDRMSTLDPDVLTPFNLINSRLFSAVLKKFFTTSQLSQFMSQKNTLDELEHLRRLSALGPGGLTKERAGFEVRDVHISHYGRICPIETPEGPTIGLVVHLASYSRLNEYGILETPYRRVKNGVIASEIVYLDASEESKYNIAHSGIEYDKDGKILENEIEARVHGQPGIVLKDKIDFIDVAPQQAFSIATSLIPFLEHDDANRALMGSNMQRQAVPCLQSEAPLVATGIEERAARDSGRLFIADDNGKISHVDATSITLKTKTGKEKNYK